MTKREEKKTKMTVQETLGGRYTYDQEIVAKIEQIVQDGNHPFREIMEAFPAYIRRINQTRYLAYYELFRMIKDTPGYIVECGIYRGFSFFAMANFLEIFCMGDKARKIIGFDNFQGFTGFSPEDGPVAKEASKKTGGWSAESFREEFMDLLDTFNQDAFAPWAIRAMIVEGNVEETIPEFVEKNPGLRISLLHLDIDLYKPTVVALKNLYPLVVPGGLVVLDEYAMMYWGGESKALEEYFDGKPPKLHTFSWVGNPNAYFFKE